MMSGSRDGVELRDDDEEDQEERRDERLRQEGGGLLHVLFLAGVGYLVAGRKRHGREARPRLGEERRRQVAFLVVGADGDDALLVHALDGAEAARVADVDHRGKRDHLAVHGRHVEARDLVGLVAGRPRAGEA